jgi:PAS domain-containing protein
MSDEQPSAAPAYSKVEDTAELVRRLCVALTNAEMFGVDHPVAKKDITAAYDWLAGIFSRRKEPMVINISGRHMLIDGITLEEKNPLVAKFAGRLDGIHVNNLRFEETLSVEEFLAFFAILSKGVKYIDAQGGFANLLQTHQVTHVKLRDISYVMITEEQKVVSRDSKIVGGEGNSVENDAEITQYLVSRILQKGDEVKWLLTAMKNAPDQMAERIQEGLELAVSRAESGLAPNDDTLDTLLKNIRMVGGSLVDETTGDLKDGQEDLEKAVLTLENEVRMRSRKLTSSSVATGFINEILAVISSYSDRVRAKQISNEFLKGEHNLRQTEKLLRDLTPQDEPGERFLFRLRDLLLKKGLTEEALEKLVGALSQPPRSRAKPRKPRKPLEQAVVDGIARRIEKLNLTGPQAQETIESLGAFVEQRAREKAGAIREEVDQLRKSTEKRNRVLESVPTGVVLWTAEGQVELINPSAQQALGNPAGIVLKPELKAFLATGSFPLLAPPQDSQVAGLTEDDMRLLMAISQIIPDENGEACGVILRSV